LIEYLLKRSRNPDDYWVDVKIIEELKPKKMKQIIFFTNRNDPDRLNA